MPAHAIIDASGPHPAPQMEDRRGLSLAALQTLLLWRFFTPPIATIGAAGAARA